MSWQIDPRQRVRLALQGNHVDRWGRTDDRGLAAQLLYTWRLDPRTALHLGTSLGRYYDHDQRTLFDGSRSLFLKISYGWQPQF